MTSVSIVIPNLNGEALLPRSLGALAAPGRYEREVILVDNGSTDDSLAVARAALPDVHVLARPTNEGFATACNRGADSGDPESPFILFLNTDVVLSPNCLDDLLGWALADAGAAVWQPKLLLTRDRGWDSSGSFFTRTGFLWHRTFDDTNREESERPGDIFAAKGACFLIRRESFAAVGGFDDSFFAYFEETDLCWRVQLAGWAVRYVPVCCAYHDVGATTARFFAAGEIDYLSFRNRITSIVKNAGSRTLVRVLPAHLLACLATAAALFARGRWRSGLAVLRALGAAFASPSHLAQVRRTSQALRTRPDSSFLPAVTHRMTAQRALELVVGYTRRW